MTHYNVFDQAEREIKSQDNVFGQFLLEKGLYDLIEITENNIYEFADLVGGHVKINAYCPKCKESRVFSCEVIYIYQEDEGRIEKYSLKDKIVMNQKYLNTDTK